MICLSHSIHDILIHHNLYTMIVFIFMIYSINDTWIHINTLYTLPVAGFNNHLSYQRRHLSSSSLSSPIHCVISASSAWRRWVSRLDDLGLPHNGKPYSCLTGKKQRHIWDTENRGTGWWFQPLWWDMENSGTGWWFQPLWWDMENSGTGWWFQPLWKIWVRQLGWIFPIYGKIIKFMFQTTNQLLIWDMVNRGTYWNKSLHRIHHPLSSSN